MAEERELVQQTWESFGSFVQRKAAAAEIAKLRARVAELAARIAEVERQRDAAEAALSATIAGEWDLVKAWATEVRYWPGMPAKEEFRALKRRLADLEARPDAPAAREEAERGSA